MLFIVIILVTIKVWHYIIASYKIKYFLVFAQKAVEREMEMSSQAESLHDGLVNELERVLLHGERAAPNAKQLEDDLRYLHSDHRLQKSQGFEETLSTIVELLRRVQPKEALQFELLTPAVCSRRYGCKYLA